MLWNGNECVKTKVIKFSKVTNCSTDYDLLKSTEKCVIFQIFG